MSLTQILFHLYSFQSEGHFVPMTDEVEFLELISIKKLTRQLGRFGGETASNHISFLL